MAQISIKIAGKEYRLPASENEASHIRKLADKLDVRAQEIKKNLPRVDSELLLVMLLLILQDEIDTQKSIIPANTSSSNIDYEPLAKKLEELAKLIAKTSEKLK